MTDIREQIDALREVCNCKYTSNPASGALRNVEMCVRCHAAMNLESLLAERDELAKKFADMLVYAKEREAENERLKDKIEQTNIRNLNRNIECANLKEHITRLERVLEAAKVLVHNSSVFEDPDPQWCEMRIDDGEALEQAIASVESDDTQEPE